MEGSSFNFELVHPICVEEIEPDYQEGLELWKAGDPEEARDALRYPLQVCPANLWVHVALGRIALDEFKDPDLARGHFGYAVDLARKVLPPVSPAICRAIGLRTLRSMRLWKAWRAASAPRGCPARLRV